MILLHLYKRRNRPVNLGGENLMGSQMLHQGFTILHQEREEHGADIIRQFRKYRSDLRIFLEMLQQIAVIGTPFFNGLSEGIKRAVAAVVAGLITLLLFTLNPSVKALAMGFQGALGTDFMVPSYLAVSYIRDFLEEMKHMEL